MCRLCGLIRREIIISNDQRLKDENGKGRKMEKRRNKLGSTTRQHIQKIKAATTVYIYVYTIIMSTLSLIPSSPSSLLVPVVLVVP